MIIVWDTVCAFIRLPMMFLLTHLLFKNRIGQVIMVLPCIKFIYLTKKNQQEYFSISNFFLRCVGRGYTACLLYGGPILALCD